MAVSLADFFGDLAVVQASLFPMDRRVIGERGGAVTPRQRGQRLWRGSVSIAVAEHGNARAVEAMVASLGDVDASFMVSPHQGQSGGETGTISAIGADRRDVTLADISAAPGDYLSASANGVYSFHYVVTSNGANVRITPPLSRQISVGDAATTDNPQLHAVATPDLSGRSYKARLSDGFDLEFVQTLRAAQ